ncbi:MAG TPA: hypothetical protein VLT33_29065 [Labilithrix sp.]|nr:hypothetical protein [Labilithrix sp.]
MDIVALLSLGTPVEVEAPLLAADLGSTPYETALLLRAPSPIPILRTDDRTRALGLLSRLRARGHDAVACDVSAVVLAAAMTQVRAFALEPDALVVRSESGSNERIGWGDFIAFVRAVHRTRSESIEKNTTQKFDLGRAAWSGGLMVTKKVTTTTKHATEEREPVVYAFRHEGAPLLLAQSRVRYEGLAESLRPSQLENFATLLRVLRERAPRAAYDERLLAARPQNDRVRAGPSGGVSSSTSDGVDLLAHLVAMAVSRTTPYRDGRA